MARRALLDERAFFCLIDVDAISHMVHMTPQFLMMELWRITRVGCKH